MATESTLSNEDLLFSDQDDMKLRDDDKRWLSGEIKTQLQAALNEAINSFKPQGARRVAHWLREWGLAATAIAVPLTLIGLLITVSIFAVNGIRENTKFQTRTEDRLENIEKELARQNLASTANLSPSAFKTALPELSSAIAAVRKKDLTVSTGVLDDIQEKMAATDTSANGYWPAAAELISYRSSLLVPALQIPLVLRFPPCPAPVDMDGADRNAGWVAAGPDGKPTGPNHPIDAVGNQNCAVQLDGRKISGWRCSHCLIKYSGGPLSMHNVQFDECLFVFDFNPDQPPPPDGRRLSTALIASRFKDVEIPSA